MTNKKFTDRRRSLQNDESSISEVIKLFMEQNKKLSKGLTKSNIKDTWAKVMGPGVCSYTHAIELKGTTLYVALTSAIIREELSYGRQKIIKMINEDLGENIVKDIFFR
jgi:hypothetical protein